MAGASGLYSVEIKNTGDPAGKKAAGREVGTL